LIQKGKEYGLDAHFVTRVFHEVIDDSVRLQQLFLIRSANQEKEGTRRVGFQGIEGAYSHLAAQKFLSQSLEGVRFTGYPTFAEVIQAVCEDVEDHAFLPIENTTAGSINEVYDLLSQANLSIVGEEVFRVEHCLHGIGDAPLSRIKRILSHPQALAQCMRFLGTLKDCQIEPYADTAMAVRKVKEDADPTQAAIASEEAGKRYGLRILRRDIADQRENYTRFLVVGRRPIKVDPRISAKTSLIVAVPHEEGALLRALNVFHEHRINLTKLESRPMPGSPFQYLFYVDFEGNIASENVKDALDALSAATSFLKILGTYPVEARGKTPPNLQAILAPARGEAAAPAPGQPQPGSTEVAAAGRRLSGRDAKAADTVISVQGVRIGGPEFIVVAGPAAVESREQIFACARQVRECGGRILRGGCFRAASPPSGFQGLGIEGLQFLAEAGREYDLPILTEVTTPDDVEAVSRVADILLVGARNMQNFGLLKEVGNVNRPVLLKRGAMSTIDEFLDAAEFILSQGNKQVILCERGIRTFETATRNTLDLASIPLLKRITHLPILVDPSRAAGQRDLVPPLALAARAVAPHGVLVEIHPSPEDALCDGAQALRFADFARLLRQIYAA
jgi:chorismate mutase/prephenate dehydratase